MNEKIKLLTSGIIDSFNTDSCDSSKKWSLLNIYYEKYLSKNYFDKALTASYPSVLSTLLDALHPKLFHETWQEVLFDNIFLHGILHESLFILVKRLEHRFVYFNFLLCCHCIRHKILS